MLTMACYRQQHVILTCQNAKMVYVALCFTTCQRGVVVITSALHAEGRRFNPGRWYICNAWLPIELKIHNAFVILKLSPRYKIRALVLDYLPTRGQSTLIRSWDIELSLKRYVHHLLWLYVIWCFFTSKASVGWMDSYPETGYPGVTSR